MKKLILSIFLCGTVLSASAQVPSYVPSNGLSGWWSFSGNANDESGNGNNGTVNGAKSTVDRNGNANKAYDFDGKANFIEVPTSISLNLDKDFTISSWFNADSMYDVPGTVKMILCKHRTGIDNDGYALGIWNNNQSTSIRGMVNFSAAPNFTTDTYPKDSSGDVVTNKWYHLLVTYTLSNGDLKYYLNGSLIDSKIINFTISSNSLNVIIGAEFFPSGTDGNNFFNGKIDDIGIWNRALDSQEINNLFNGVYTSNVQNGYSKSSISVYPNPAKDRFVIDFGNSSNVAEYDINIFDVTGKSVYNSKINKSVETIDLNTWTGKGIYFIKIYDKQSQQIENRKIVIQ